MGKKVVKGLGGMSSCMLNAQLAHTALVDYAEDNDGKLPEADNWQQDVESYYMAAYEDQLADLQGEDMPDFFEGMFQPAEPGRALTCSFGDIETGFAFNSDYAGAVLDDIEDPDYAVLLFETETASYNQAGSFEGYDADPPKIMGEERDWIVMYAEGNNDVFSSGGGNVTIRSSRSNRNRADHEAESEAAPVDESTEE
jgi:hypothetical protein